MVLAEVYPAVTMVQDPTSGALIPVQISKVGTIEIGVDVLLAVK